MDESDAPGTIWTVMLTVSNKVLAVKLDPDGTMLFFRFRRRWEQRRPLAEIVMSN